MSVSFIACSSDDDDNNDSLAGTTWKVTSVDNAVGEFKYWPGATATLNADGTVTFNPKNAWTYAQWTLKDNTLKIVIGEGHPDDYIEGTLSVNGNSATWDCYWGNNPNSNRTCKDGPHIVHLQKQ